MDDLRVQVEGLIRSPTSWSRVLREMAHVLYGMDGVDLALKPHRGFQWERSFPLPERLEQCPVQWEDPEAVLAFPYPPRLNRYSYQADRLWALSVYEATRLPPSWLTPLQQIPHRVVVPSRHTQRIYRESGVPGTKLQVIPYGYNPEQFPEPKSPVETFGKPLRLLTIATPHYRKGLDLLDEISDFIDHHPLEWHVHLPYETDPGNTRFWEDPDIPDQLRQNGFRVTTGTRTDGEIAALLREADLVVQPSRSEGFGLVILEAMAAATAVVVPEWGGHLDFQGKGMITVEGELRPAGPCQYDERAEGARVFEPSVEHLRSRLRDLLTNPETLPERGREARETVKSWTWKAAARRFIQSIRRDVTS